MKNKIWETIQGICKDRRKQKDNTGEYQKEWYHLNLFYCHPEKCPILKKIMNIIDEMEDSKEWDKTIEADN
jgi:hypothetical protein